ncbi:MAG: hypothetical protein GX346_01440 [Clostridiales bacterium]|nr:hypothetical protein [Clostridiales bacterium]
MPVGFTTDEQSYYYKKNAQGDIVAILDSNGVELASYTYDAWGNITSVSGDEQLAESNPFRYRGYYQDSESGFFYLQSRYYDSIVGRFLNADDVRIALVTNGIGLHGNLYSYCSNNPVNQIDDNGHFGTPLQWLCAFIGGYVGWRIGDWVARKIGLFDGQWWQWQTSAYWTVRGLVVAGGAILGWIAGTALLGYLKGYLAANTAVLTRFPLPIQKFVMWFLGIGGNKVASYLTELYNRYASHIFSSQHIKDGIMRLGGTKRQIFDKIMNVVTLKMPQAATGSNQIHTTINGIKVTIRFFVKDGTIQSVNAFVGWTERIIGNLLR